MTSIQLVCDQRSTYPGIAAKLTHVMDMSANCCVPTEGLTSSVFPTSQTVTQLNKDNIFFLRGQLI